MFISPGERKDSCYLEFQYCETNRPIVSGRVDIGNIGHWYENSILISDDDFTRDHNDFWGKYFECALLPNGETGFDLYGVNYYSREVAREIFDKLKSCTEEKYPPLLTWLEKACEYYNGFYILGI